MTALAGYVNGLAERWACGMWPVLWQSALLALVVLLLTLLFRRLPAAVRFWLWMLVPLRLMAMPLVTVSLPVLPGEPGGLVSLPPVATAVEPWGFVPAEMALDVPPQHVAAAASLPPTGSGRGTVPVRLTVWSLLMAAWIGGMAFALVRLLRGCHVMRGIVGRASGPSDPALPEVACEVALTLGFRQPPHVLLTEEEVAPFVWGVARPAVVLPAGLVRRISRDQLRAVLAHEFAHLRRRDAVTGWMLALCEVPYFFHPAFHLAKRRLMFEREAACDDCALGLANAPRSLYAETLVAAAEACGRPRHHVLPVVTATESFQDLRRRIVLIFSDLRRTARLSIAAVVLIALMVGISLPGIVLTARGVLAAKDDASAEERPLPAGALMRLGTTRLRHDGAVTGVVFTPDGRNLVSCAFDDKIRVWDVATGRQTAEFGDSWHWGMALAVSPDGRRLFVGGRGLGDKVRVWDLATGTVVMSAPGNRLGVTHSAMSPDGKTLATAGEEGKVYLWKMEKGLEFIETPFAPPKTIGMGIGGLAFSPDGKLLAVGSVRGEVWIWEVGSEKEPLTMSVADGYVQSVAFSPDGKVLASSGARSERTGEGQPRTLGHIWIWDPATGKKLLEFEAHATEGARGIAFSPDGRMLASVASLGNVALWDPATGRRTRTLAARRDDRGSYGAVAFSPDGKVLATGGPGVAVSLWDVGTGEPLVQDAEAHTDVVKRVGVSRDGAIIASCSWDGIRLWDATTGKRLRAVRADRGGFYDAAFSADGKLLASAGSDGSVRLWDSASGKEVQSFPGDWRVAPNRVAFSRDGSLLAAVYVSYPPFPTPASSTVRVWQVGTRQDLLNLGPVEGRGERMAFSGDGKVLACVSGGRGTVYSWDIPAGTERPVVELPGNLPTTVVGLSRDAKILVDLDPEAGAVTLLNPVTGKTIRSISVPGEYLSPAVFSADNALLAASSRTMFRPTAPAYEEKRTLRVFETATGRELVKLDVKDQGTVLSLAFFPDRKRLVTGMTNTTVLVWDLSPAK